jgi:hypothetical protein
MREGQEMRAILNILGALFALATAYFLYIL